MKKFYFIFFSVFIIFISLFTFTLGSVHAESGQTIGSLFGDCNGFLTLSGWTSSSSYESGYIVNFSPNDINSSLLNNLNNLEVPSEIPNIDSKKIYVFYEQGNNFDIIFLDNKYNVQDYAQGILALGFSQDLTDTTIYKVLYSLDTQTNQYSYTITTHNPLYDGGANPPINYASVGDGGYLCAASDVIYACDNYTGNLSNAMSYFAYYLVNYSNQPYQYINSNYIAIDMGNDGGFGGSGGSSGENASNNLYMNNPKWQFNNIPSFGSLLDSNSKGSAVFSGQLTDYQKQNLDKFKLQFSFNTFWSGYTVRIGSDDVTPITTNFSKSFLYETEVSLSDFYNSGGISSFYIDDIFENSVSNDVDQTINDFADFYIHEYGFGTNTFRTSFNVKLVALDNSGDSGTCTAYYSYKTGSGQTTNNSMGINSNPYVDDDGNSTGVTDPFDSPSGSGSGVGNVGDGSIVNNNNPVININNNNQFEDGDSDGLLSKILLLLANNQTASSDGLSEVADTTGYVQVLGETFTAVPTNWWTVLTAAFIASIGIIVVSFVLKVILNFVT